MSERWRRPVIPISIEDEPSQIVTVDVKTGAQERKIYRDVKLVLSDEDVDRIRTGYVCIWCQEPFEKPFPEECPVCGFECRKRQADLFASQYQGWDEPLTPLGEKLAALDEQDARKVHQPGKSIWLPRGIDP